MKFKTYMLTFYDTNFLHFKKASFRNPHYYFAKPQHFAKHHLGLSEINFVSGLWDSYHVKFIHTHIFKQHL
jgi:hypothetical protein